MLPEPLETEFRTYFAPGTATPAARSVLYLLRRDAAQCFGFNPNTYDIEDNQAVDPNSSKLLWPGVMTVFAGFDLLAKFYAGSELEAFPQGTTQEEQWRHRSGSRLKSFVRKYVTNDNENEAKTLYQLRCALDHSFALWARDRDGDTYSFTLSEPDFLHANVLLRMRTGVDTQQEAIVYIFELHKRFQQSAIAFQEDYYQLLDGSGEDRNKFQELVNHYGFIGIANASVFGW